MRSASRSSQTQRPSARHTPRRQRLATPSPRGGRRSRRPEPHRLARALAGCGLLTLAALPTAPAGAQTAAPALPSGLAVAAGQAQAVTAGNRMTVTNSPNAILNWNSFSIGNGAAVHFQQQAPTSQVLNRVTGADPSNILGSLSSNGRVWLLNPNGVLFGQSAQVDVAGLVASTLRLNDADWLAGRWRFGLAPGAADAAVVNQGELRTPFGGSVALVGGSVDNQGLVTAPGGQIVLAAGKSVELVDTGAPNLSVRISAPAGEARNLGTLQAAGGRIDIHAASVNQQGIVSADTLTAGPGGEVWIKASGAVELAAASRTSADGAAAGGSVHVESASGRTSVRGSVSAQGAGGSGGQVALLGNEVGLFDAAQVDASGRSGGGEVLVGGGERGADPAYANARAVYIGPETVLRADASAQGDGGRIVVWSDESTRAFGSFSVRGGPNGGNGGFIETSGGWLDARPARIDASAPAGLAGRWLLDPYDITISDYVSADGGYDSSFTATGNSATIFSGRIEDALEAGTNVTVSTGGAGAGSQAGNITLDNAYINVFAAAPGNLTLLADGNITLNESRISALQGPQTVTLRAGRSGSGSVTLTNSTIDVSGEYSEGGSPVAGTRAIVIGGFSSGQLPVDAGTFANAARGVGAAGVTLSNATLRAGSGGTVAIAGVSAAGTGSSGSFDGVNLTDSQISGRDIDIHGDSSTGNGVRLSGTSIDAARSIALRGTGQRTGTLIADDTQLAIDPLAPADAANGLLVQGRTRAGSGYDGVLVEAGDSVALQTIGGAPITVEAGNAGGGGALGVTASTSGSAVAIDTSAGGGLVTLRSNGVEDATSNNFANGSVNVSGATITVGAAGLDVDAAGTLALAAGITSAGPVRLGGYRVELRQGATVSSTAGGDAIVVAGHDDGGNRQLQALTVGDSSVRLTTVSGGRWIVYATSQTAFDGNTERLLNYGFKQHGAAYGDWSAYSGNGFVFGDTPTANYAGTLTTRVYDGTLTARVASASAEGQFGDLGVLSTAPVGALYGDKNAGTNKAATLATPASAFNFTDTNGKPVYGYALAGTLTGTVTRATLTASTVVAADKVYDASTTATVNIGAQNGLVGNETVGVSATGRFADKNVGTGKDVSATYSVTNGTNGGLAANYQFVSPLTLTAAITPRAIGIGGVTANNKVYDRTTTASVSGSATVTPLAGDNLALAGTATYSFADHNVGSAKPVSVGVANMRLTGNDANNYTLVGSTLAADITPRPYAVGGVSVLGKTYDATTAATLTGSATGTAIQGDQVVLSATSTASARFADKNVGSAKAVTVSGFTLSGADAGNYAVVQPTGLTASITPRAVAVSGVTADAKVYDGATVATLSGTASAATLAGDAVTLGGSASGRFADKNVGTAKPVSVTGYLLQGADAANYTLSQPGLLYADITPRAVTLTGLTAADKVYDGTTTATLSGTASLSVLSGDSVTLTGTATAARFADKNVGIDKPVSVSGLGLAGADAANYTLSQPVGLVADITRRPVTLTGLSAADKVYDGTTVATLSGTPVLTVLPGDAVTLTGLATAARFADKNVGVDKAVTVRSLGLAGADAANYTLSQPVGLVADITPRAVTLTGLTAADKVYDGTTVATLSGTASLSVLSGDSVTLTGSATAARFADKNVGVDKPVSVAGLGLAGADAANYTLAQPVGLVADITPRAVTLAGLTAADKVYDGTTVATLSGTASLSVLSGDSVTLTGTATAARFADKNVGVDKPVSVSGLGLAGADAANYTLSQPVGLVADITPRAVTLTGLTAADKVYDGTTVATLSGTASLSVLSGDSVTLTGTATAARFADKNVGIDKAVSVAGLGLAGADAANYTLSQPTGLVADITPRAVTLTGLTAADKVYDGTTVATLSGTASLSVLFGDSVTLTGSATAARFADKNVGVDKAVSVAGLGLAGADAANYTLSQPTGLSASITPLGVTVTGVAAADKVYDATTTAALTGSAAIATLTGDAVLLAGTPVAAFADKNVGSAKPVGVTGYRLDGADAANYRLAQPGGLSAAITPRPLLATGAVAADKVYDGTTAATLLGLPTLPAAGGSGSAPAGSSSAGALPGDALSLAGTAAASFADANVGDGKTVRIGGLTLAGADASNYRFDGVAPTAASITPATLQYVAEPAVRNAGSALDGFAGSVTGFVGAETVATATTGALTFGTPATAASPAGSYPLLGSGLAAANYRFVQAPANASALSIVAGGPSVADVVADVVAAQNAQVDTLLPQRVLPLASNAGTADNRVLVAIAPTASGPLTTTAASTLAASFAPVTLSRLSPGAIQQMLDSRAIYMRTVLADATAKLEDDPTLADLKACETAAEAQRGTCLLTAKLKSRLAAAAPTAEAAQPSSAGEAASPSAAAAAAATPPAAPAAADVAAATAAAASGAAAAIAPAAPAEVAAPASPLDDTTAQRRRVRSAALPQIDRKIALMIGVDRYADPAIPSLTNAVRDARAVGRVFADKLGYEVVTVPDATRANVVAALNRLALTLGPRDSVVVYYAGHGDLVEATGMGYWLLADSNARQPETWLSNADISRSIAQMGARQVALVSDSCYSGSLTSEERIRASAAALDPKVVLDRKSVVVMSSGGNEPVFDDGKDGHSPFAWNLMNTLGQVANWQAGSNVFERVRFAVARALPQRPQYSASRAAGHQPGGDYLFEERQLDGGRQNP